jgi:hypothetical protein
VAGDDERVVAGAMPDAAFFSNRVLPELSSISSA